MEDLGVKFIQTRESLEFALESGKMATWELDLETNKISCSKEMLDLWGVSTHEFLNERSILQSKVHPDDLELMRNEIKRSIDEQSIYELEYRIIPSPGQIRWVLSRGRCTPSPTSDRLARMAGIVYDITDKKEKDLLLAQATRARSDFFAIAGHELKTPLTCLQLQLNVMEMQLKEAAALGLPNVALAKSLKKQSEHLLRMSHIVDNMLDESRISEGLLHLQTEPGDLVKMTQEMIERVKVIAEAKGVEIKFASPESILGEWDHFRLEQVLLNLLMNAIRYGNKKPIQIDLSHDQEHAVILVRDEGMGIKEEDQEKIFKRFERVNHERSNNGMGLGLYISNSIVRAHGGEIRLKSKFGMGSDFTVVVPRYSVAISMTNR